MAVPDNSVTQNHAKSIHIYAICDIELHMFLEMSVLTFLRTVTVSPSSFSCNKFYEEKRKTLLLRIHFNFNRRITKELSFKSRRFTIELWSSCNTYKFLVMELKGILVMTS